MPNSLHGELRAEGALLGKEIDEGEMETTSFSNACLTSAGGHETQFWGSLHSFARVAKEWATPLPCLFTQRVALHYHMLDSKVDSRLERALPSTLTPQQLGEMERGYYGDRDNGFRFHNWEGKG